MKVSSVASMGRGKLDAVRVQFIADMTMSLLLAPKRSNGKVLPCRPTALGSPALRLGRRWSGMFCFDAGNLLFSVSRGAQKSGSKVRLLL